ncbi:MAG: amino acid ABC transporter permease [Candidatus Bathyarchaeota archaeon]|nr:MAG: amino acid ABC transporter permease [Candidatus Bathyarchaeota archaeon]
MYEFIPKYLPFFLKGLQHSFILALVPLALGFLVGLLAALADVYRGRTASTLISIYVEFFRGSPLIVQAILFYWFIPQDLLGMRIDRLMAALLVFTLNSGAYQKGYIKGAIEAVHEDQMTAARALGMSKLKAIRHVVLPQALRIVIPGWTNEYASMSKSTSAALAIGIPELANISMSVASWTFRSFETYTFTALLYFIWIFFSVKVLEMVYERVKIPGFEA